MTAAIDQLEGLWTAQEAAKELNISFGYVHKLCRKHGLGLICNGGRWLSPDEMRSLYRLVAPAPDFSKPS
jgi:hypothetical protein